MPTSPSRTLRLFLLPFLLALPSLGAALPPAISGLSISPDGGKALASIDTDGVPNAWALPLAGGTPVQLTREKRPVWVVGYFPKDERFVYRSGPLGDEDHLFVREPDGKAVELSPGKRSRFLGWSGDGRSMWIEVLNAGTQTRDLLQVALDGYGQTRIDRNSSQISRLALVSPDGHYLAYTESYADLTRNIRMRDRQTEKDRTLEAGEGFNVKIPLRFTQDGKGLLALSDEDANFRYLIRVDPVTGEKRILVKKDWDLLDARESPDGRRLAVVAGGDTRSSLELYDAATLKPLPLPELPGLGEVSAAAFSPDGRTLVFAASGSALPPGVWAIDLEKPGAPRRLFGGEAGDWVAGEVVRFNSFDGQSIPGILYKPAGATANRKALALVWIHDGPSGQSRLAFDPLVQTLVRRGYAVYAINHRGSFGYGKSFLQLDDRRHGQGDLQDCVAAKAMLAATGWVDAGRIAVGGVGFGGFLTLDALAFQPQEFAAGVDLFGVADWRRVLDEDLPHTSTERTVLAEEMGYVADMRAREMMTPRDQAGDIVRPLILVQGGRDSLAIPADAEAIAARMKAGKKPVELLTLPEEGHGFALRESREKVYEAVAGFLDRHLKAAPPKK
jgi:Tol biopolymer transport system component/dienelactone hydrolase